MRTLYNEMRGARSPVERSLLSEAIQSPTTTKKMCDLLNKRLADALDLYLHAKQAHWNVKGETFMSLHTLFDSVADHSHAWADSLAEQVVILGDRAIGTVDEIAEHTSLPKYKVKTDSAAAHIKALTESLATFASLVRDAAKESEEAKDMVTNDLFLGILHQIDKDHWFVKSHQE